MLILRPERCVPDWHHRHQNFSLGEHKHAHTLLWHACCRTVAARSAHARFQLTQPAAAALPASLAATIVTCLKPGLLQSAQVKYLSCAGWLHTGASYRSRVCSRFPTPLVLVLVTCSRDLQLAGAALARYVLAG
jgi:hypothetical protein